MTWFKVDDTLWGHPKWIAASPRARALWVTAGSWCASQLQDGRIPNGALALLGGRKVDADELVTASLWHAMDGGWIFHDWEKYQPMREQVEARRDAEREKKRIQRQRGAASVSRGDSGRFSSMSPGDTPRDSRGVSTATRPVPSLNTPLPPTAPTPPPTPSGSSATADGDRDRPTFDTFWDAYPRHDAKPKARAAWSAATRDTHPRTILDGLLAALPRLTAVTDPRFIPAPTTWLRDQRWLDDPPATPASDPDSPWRDDLYLPPPTTRATP